MRTRPIQPPDQSSSVRSNPLLLGTSACGLLWLAAVAGVNVGLPTVALVALGTIGALVTVGVLLAIQVQHRRLLSMATTDALTGLPNHGAYHAALEVALGHARENGTPLAVVALDLDQFKQINDTHGHPYGDQVLRAVADALRAAIRPDDVAARTGGDEFGLILVGATGANAIAIAERARDALATIRVREFELSCSAGIAVYPHDAGDPATLVELADSTLYWAKRGGKGRARRFDADHAPTVWSGRQLNEVRELLALERPIEPVFQPVVSLATGRIVGFEALARFNLAPQRPADVWFAQAHRSGLGAELEAAAIRAALQAPGRPLDAHLAVNVSPSALDSPDVVEALAGDLTGIVIEITEHEFVPDDDALSRAIAELRRRGALIAIDDAGAGYAGLARVINVHPDIVKFDRALTRDIHTDRARMALVESFVRFARDVDVTVCAEGIESLDELAAIADLDVQWGQGFGLARPGAAWPTVSTVAAEVCRASMAESFRSPPSIGHPLGSRDRRLVHLSARLASATTRVHLEGALGLMADELDASIAALSAWHPERGALETVAESGPSTGESVFSIADYPLTARVLEAQEAVQVFVGDPAADPREVELLLRLGERSLLMVPVVAGGDSLGMLEIYRLAERPWSRAEINRARVVANQCASVIGGFVNFVRADDRRLKR
jgi:diguanylate cyclase (GGDEF)-like protein